MTKTYGKTAENLKVLTRFKNPYDNLLYAILLQAVADNDIDYLKHGDGRIIWEHLKKAERS